MNDTAVLSVRFQEPAHSLTESDSTIFPAPFVYFCPHKKGIAPNRSSGKRLGNPIVFQACQKLY